MTDPPIRQYTMPDYIFTFFLSHKIVITSQGKAPQIRLLSLKGREKQGKSTMSKYIHVWIAKK